MIRLTLILLTLLMAPQIHASVVRVDTQFGSFYIDLLENDAPNTVANFLNYVRDDDFRNTFVHRADKRFVIQGGGFTFLDGEFGEVSADPPIANEFGLSNLRGTVAMAKLAGDPDSATSEWFINLDDTNVSLDTNNGGFTVFGRVMGEGMDIVNRIASIEPVNLGNGLGEVPLIYNGILTQIEQITTTNLVMTTITEVDGFEINAGLSGTWFNAATPGQGWLVDVINDGDRREVFIAWFTYDVNAPAGDEGSGFGSTQHRWFTASGTFTGDTASLTISRNTGGIFNDPTATTTDAVGTMTVQFTDCTSGILAFDFDDETVPDDMVNITRLSPDAFCTALAIPAQ